MADENDEKEDIDDLDGIGDLPEIEGLRDLRDEGDDVGEPKLKSFLPQEKSTALKKSNASLETRGASGDEASLLKVIEEAVEEKETEVVRLEQNREPALKDPSKKVKARADRNLLNTMLNDPLMDDFEGQEKSLFYDEEWMSRTPDVAPSSVPMGWFALVIGVLGLIVLWSAYQLVFAEKKPFDMTADRAGLTEDGRFKIPLSRKEENEERESAAAAYSLLESRIADYFRATTIEEKLKYLRHPKRVEPLMRDYYSRHDIEEIGSFKLISEFYVISLDNRPFTALLVLLNSGESVALLAEPTPEGPLFDWESEVAYQPMAPEEFMEKRPAEALEFRVYASSDNYFSYEFSDEEKWLCFKLTFRESEEYLFGYLPVSEREYMEKLLGSPDLRLAEAKHLILRLRFPEGGKGPRSVLIDEVVAERWAYVVDPDEGSEKSNPASDE